MPKHDPSEHYIPKEQNVDETKQFAHDLNQALSHELRTRKKKDRKRGGDSMDNSWRLQKPSVIHITKLESFDGLSLSVDGRGRVVSGATPQPLQGPKGHRKHGSLDSSVRSSIGMTTSHVTKPDPRRVTENKNFTKTPKPPIEDDPRLIDFSGVLKTFDLAKVPKDPVPSLKAFTRCLKRASLASDPYLWSYNENDTVKPGGSRAMLKMMGIQASLLALNDFVDDGFFDSTMDFVRLAQSLTFSYYFQQNVKKLVQYVMQSERAKAIKENVAEFVNESVPHLGVGASLVALNDMQEGWLPEDTVFSLGCVMILAGVAMKDKGII